MQRVGRAGGIARLAATAAVLALVLAGTVWGQDSAFPVGPFRMFSTRDDPNAVIRVTRIDGVLAGGARVTITGTETGLRRAEVEGQLARFVADPDLLAAVAAAYARRHPDAPALARIEIVQREHLLTDGRANGYRDTILAGWSPR